MSNHHRVCLSVCVCVCVCVILIFVIDVFAVSNVYRFCCDLNISVRVVIFTNCSMCVLRVDSFANQMLTALDKVLKSNWTLPANTPGSLLHAAILATKINGRS